MVRTGHFLGDRAGKKVNTDPWGSLQYSEEVLKSYWRHGFLNYKAPHSRNLGCRTAHTYPKSVLRRTRVFPPVPLWKGRWESELIHLAFLLVKAAREHCVNMSPGQHCVSMSPGQQAVALTRLVASSGPLLAVDKGRLDGSSRSHQKAGGGWPQYLQEALSLCP